MMSVSMTDVIVVGAMEVPTMELLMIGGKMGDFMSVSIIDDRVLDAIRLAGMGAIIGAV